jgi:hypothetical protein
MVDRLTARLERAMRRLAPEQRRAVVEFAEFLAQRHVPDTEQNRSIVPIPRPAGETVMAALQRLSATYPMLDRDELLGASADLVAQHVVGGRPASDVIDDLERLFHERRERNAPEGD